MELGGKEDGVIPCVEELADTFEAFERVGYEWTDFSSFFFAEMSFLYDRNERS